MVTAWPSARTVVALPVPTTAGTPSSRLTIAAWLVGPPWSVTMPAARFMIGTQSGSVISVTRMAPSRKLSMSAALRITHAVPCAIAVADRGAGGQHRAGFSAGGGGVNREPVFCDWTVSGRAWTMNSSPVTPSLAHSMSIGRP